MRKIWQVMLISIIGMVAVNCRGDKILPSNHQQPQQNQRVLTCSSLFHALDFRDNQDLQMGNLSHLQFVDEDTLRFAGTKISSQNPQYKEMPITTGELHLTSRSYTFDALGRETPLSSHCNGQCQFRVISQSPDRQWQILYHPQTPYDGFQLVGQHDSMQLVNFTPFWSQWQWAEDSSWLWFQYDEKEYGRGAKYIRLETTPLMLNSSSILLKPTYFDAAFSPVDKTAVMFANPERVRQWQWERNDLRPDYLYFVNFTQPMDEITTPISRELATNIAWVGWNEATKEFLTVFEESDHGAIHPRDSNLQIELPLAAIEATNTNFASAQNAEEKQTLFHLIFPFEYFTFSPTYQRLAVSDHRTIYVYDCQ